MRTVVAGLVLVGLLLAACAPASPEESGEASVAESEAAAESQAESVAASESAFAFPSFTSGAVAELEAFIPDEIGEIPMQTFSMLGDEFLGSGNEDPATEQFLRDLGVSPSDVAMAFGFGVSEDYESSAAMFVFRAEGAPTDRLVSVFKAATDEDREVPLNWTQTTIAGKTVETAVDPEQDNQTVYLYAVGDVLFVVSATDPAAAQEAIAGLP